MRLRDVLLHQPDTPQESMQMSLPWHAPPYMTPTSPDVIDTPRDQRTPEEIATYLKRRFLPQNLSGKRNPEIRWVTTCLTFEPTEETAPRYADWEASYDDDNDDDRPSSLHVCYITSALLPLLYRLRWRGEWR
jgi:hypothetical protein